MKHVCVEVYMHRLYVFWRSLQFRVKRKLPLAAGQTGRTHKRKPRGTRKRGRNAERALQKLKTMNYDSYRRVLKFTGKAV